MDDLISRQAAIAAIEFDITYAKAINKETGEVTVMFEKENKALEDAVTRIKQLPPAQPKRGRWILHTYLPHHNYCSICEKDSPYNKRWNFCPNCGSYNGGEQDDSF